MDIARVLAALTAGRAHLDVSAVEIGLLVLVAHRCEVLACASLADSEVRGLYVQSCEAVGTDLVNHAANAVRAIDRLVEQRLLLRLTTHGLDRTPEFALSSLGQSIARFHIDEERQTAERLSALLQTIHAAIVLVRNRAADLGRDNDAWRLHVIVPLETQVTELVSAIERRNRGLTRANDEVRLQITDILRGDWYSGIERCQHLLRTTSETLDELKSILLTDGSRIIALLDDIGGLAQAQGAFDAMQVSRRVSQQVTQIEGWSRQAYGNWSIFYRQVQEYIRSFVRLDPGRAVEARLTQVARSWATGTTAWSLLVADGDPLLYLRKPDVEHRPGIVSGPIADLDAVWEREHDEIDVADLIQDAEASGARTVPAVAAYILPLVPEERRYGIVGGIIDHLASRVGAPSQVEPVWLPVADGIDVEDRAIAAPEPDHVR